MNTDDSSEEKNSSDIDNESRIRPEGIQSNLTMRRVLQHNLLDQMNASVQQQRRDNEETQQRYLIHQLQEEDRRRQVLQILQSRQTEAQQRQLQQQRELLLQPIVDVADQTNILTPAATLQLLLYQQRENQQQMLQRIHGEGLRRLQLQHLLLEQQERRQQQLQFIQMERDQAPLHNVSGPEIRNIIASLPMRGNIDIGNASTGVSSVEINRLQSAEISGGSNVISLRNRNLSLPMRRDIISSNVGIPEVSGIDVARVQAAILQANYENFAVAAKDSGHGTQSDVSDSMVLPAWSETSAQLMQKTKKTDSKSGVAATKKKTPLRRKIVGMVRFVEPQLEYTSGNENCSLFSSFSFYLIDNLAKTPPACV